jgi:hypothetical protein
VTDEWSVVFSEDPLAALDFALHGLAAPESLRSRLSDLKGRTPVHAGMPANRLTVLAVLRNARLGRWIEAELALDHALAGAPLPDALMPPLEDERVPPRPDPQPEKSLSSAVADLSLVLRKVQATLGRVEDLLAAGRPQPPAHSLLPDDDE